MKLQVTLNCIEIDYAVKTFPKKDLEKLRNGDLKFNIAEEDDYDTESVHLFEHDKNLVYININDKDIKEYKANDFQAIESPREKLTDWMETYNVNKNEIAVISGWRNRGGQTAIFNKFKPPFDPKKLVFYYANCKDIFFDINDIYAYYGVTYDDNNPDDETIDDPENKGTIDSLMHYWEGDEIKSEDIKEEE